MCRWYENPGKKIQWSQVLLFQLERMYPLGRTVCSWPTWCVYQMNEQIAALRSHRLMPIRHKKAICLLLFMLLHMGQKKVEPEADPWNYSASVQNQLSLSTSRWRSFITPMWWHLLWSFSRVWTWSKGCCSFSPQTPETNKSLFVLPCICTDAAVPLLLQICNHSKLPG